MKLGLMLGYSVKRMSVPIDLIQGAEQLGYDSVWIGDSLLDRPRHEPRHQHGRRSERPIWVACQTLPGRHGGPERGACGKLRP